MKFQDYPKITQSYDFELWLCSHQKSIAMKGKLPSDWNQVCQMKSLQGKKSGIFRIGKINRRQWSD